MFTYDTQEDAAGTNGRKAGMESLEEEGESIVPGFP